MSPIADPNPRLMAPDDLGAVGQMLHDFNTEFDEPTPPATELTQRLGQLTATGETVVIVAGDGPDALAVLRLRSAIWSRDLECHLAELYVRPALRGQGLGRAVLEKAIAIVRSSGAATIDLGTSEDDTAARALYESLGFLNSEGPGGPTTYLYQRDL